MIVSVKHVSLGDTVRWSRGKKPLGKVVHFFQRYGDDYAVVEGRERTFIVCRIYEELVVESTRASPPLP